MHDVDMTVEHTPTTPRQSISSSPTTPRQHMNNAFEVPRSISANTPPGLHVVRVDHEHLFARWGYKLEHHDFGTRKASDWRQFMGTQWLRDLRPELTFALVSERAAITVCRYIIQAYICVNAPDSPAMTLRDDWSLEIDLIIYIYHNPQTKTVCVRFMAEGTQRQDLEDRVMGFELDTGRRVQTIRFSPLESWIDTGNYFTELLEWHWLFIKWSELQPFTWPSNDEDVQRVQSLKSRLGHGANRVTLL